MAADQSGDTARPHPRRHECEDWQMQEPPDGGRYCAACGAIEDS